MEETAMGRSALVWLVGAAVSLLIGSGVQAQDMVRGRALARQVCSICHAVESGEAPSPNAAAPRFETIANVPGMTATALAVALRTPHSTMPNLVLDSDELDGIVAYILSFKRAD
jgi:mono/diheme cytochrome c family protein